MEEDSGFFSNEELETLMLFFLDQASMLLDSANQCLLKLEMYSNDAEALNQLQRTLHTLKGDANSVGFGEIGTVAHKLEDLVALWGTATELTIEILDLLLFGIDALDDMLQRKRQWVHAPLEIDSIIDRIDRFIYKHSEQKKVETKSIELAFELDEYQKLKIQTAILENSSAKLWKLIAYFDSDCAMHGAGLLMLVRELNKVGEVVVSFPDINSEQLDSVNHVAVIILAEDPDIIEKNAVIIGITSSVTIEPVVTTSSGFSFSNEAKESEKDVLQTPKITNTKSSQSEQVENQIENQVESQIENQIENQIESQETKLNQILEHSSNIAAKENTTTNVEILRVNASKIDFLMDLVGELVINRSMLNQMCNQLKVEFPKHAKIRRLMDIDSYLGRLLGQLQKTVMEVRMVSLDQTFNRFFRVVRDLARDGGKQVELSIVGEDTELDKRVVDTIYEPLLHLVRNAVDHGIESIEERVKIGKAPQGKLQLKAYYQTDQVVIEIIDDGRGINIEKLKQKVVERRLRTFEEVEMLKKQDAYDLMFLSGVSTASQVTEVSGRGIGMQVVKTVISNLKGSIEVNSQPKQGTTFILRLPLTLAIIRTMLFSIEERVFAIPLASVVDIARLNKEDIKHIGNHKVFSRNDTLHSLVELDNILLGENKQYNNPFVLTVGLGERRIGLMVEKVIGEREVVVKAVDKQWITSDLVAGASILGDGRVVLILDIGALFQRTNLAMSARQ